MSISVEQPVPPEPYCPPLEIVAAYEKSLASADPRGQVYTLFFKASPKDYAKKLAKLHQRTHWSPGDDEQLLLAEKHFALTDTHLHLLHGRREGYEHVALPIAEIEAIEFRPPPRAEYLRMTLITEPSPSVVITRYKEAANLYTAPMDELIFDLLGSLIRNAHGYPMEFTDEEYAIATRTEVVRYAITEILQGTATVTIQRSLSERYALSSYDARELVVRTRYLTTALSPKQASRALWGWLATMVGIIFIAFFVYTTAEDIDMALPLPFLALALMPMLFAAFLVLALIPVFFAVFPVLQRKRDATASPDELCQWHLDAIERARDQASNRDELPTEIPRS